ncbi:MAG: type II toxin-antitoxin system VapC family toxin [Chloroflexi bacterium]|nr:type II toxin-antitoxin system VapC family toxin [Chloroflexota bacterium]
MFLMDTNAISEVRKGARCDAHVRDWYSRVDEAQLFISSLSIGQIRRGIELARRRGDLPQADTLESWLETVRAQFSSRVLPVDDSVANIWGRLAATRPVPVIDGLLATTAIVHNLVLVTRNVPDVDGLGATLLNLFLPATGDNKT